MSKRTQSIRSLFSGGGDAATDDEARQPMQRVAAGAVRSLKDTFSEVEREYEALKRSIADGSLPVELDPSTLDASPFADRFDDQDVAAIEALKTSIKDHGQEIPILVRVHPSEPGRYQIAYGHRRARVAKELGVSVKALVRELDDDKLVVAQGIENSAREDLSFIERAAFALKLEAGGFNRNLIQGALSVDRAEVSKLIAVAQSIPSWLIGQIGRAPKVGRGRWMDLAETLKLPRAEQRARKAAESKVFAHKNSDDRFKIIINAIKSDDATKASLLPATTAVSAAGDPIAKLSISTKHCKIELDRTRDEAFARFVMQQLPSLYDTFKNDNEH